MLHPKGIFAVIAVITCAQALPAFAQQAATPALVAVAAPATGGTLRIATWAGAYGQAQKEAVFDPFAKETGMQVDTSVQASAGGISSNNWDVADLSAASASELCDQGALEVIDPALLKAAPDGTAAAADFLPGGLGKCAVGSLAWSSVVLYMGDSKDAKSGKPVVAPKSLKDFFDVARIPGKRGLPRDPRYVLELALLADGVPPDDIYKQLGSRDGVQRALRSIASIRSQIVWWSDPQQALTLLKDRSVVMTMGYSGRAFMEIATGTKPIKILWDGQIYDVDVWAVSKTASNKPEAMKFIAFASGADRLAETARQLPYGPMRRSAVALVGNHAILGTDLKPFLPTAPDNLATALRFDGTFWKSHQEELTLALEDWIENPPSKSGVGRNLVEPQRTSAKN